MSLTIHDLINNEIYLEIRTKFNPYEKDSKPKFYFYVYSNSTELVQNDIMFINNELHFFNSY